MSTQKFQSHTEHSDRDRNSLLSQSQTFLKFQALALILFKTEEDTKLSSPDPTHQHQTNNYIHLLYDSSLVNPL